jgi:hypothetical protein
MIKISGAFLSTCPNSKKCACKKSEWYLVSVNFAGKE